MNLTAKEVGGHLSLDHEFDTEDFSGTETVEDLTEMHRLDHIERDLEHSHDTEYWPGIPSPAERQLNDLSDEEVERQNTTFIDQLVLDIANMLKTVCQTGANSMSISIPIRAQETPYNINIEVVKT